MDKLCKEVYKPLQYKVGSKYSTQQGPASWTVAWVLLTNSTNALRGQVYMGSHKSPLQDNLSN